MYFYIFLNVFDSRGRHHHTSKVSESDFEGLAPGHSLPILLTLNDGHPSEYDDSRPNERSDDFWICSDCVGFVSDLEWNHQTNNLNDQLQNIQILDNFRLWNSLWRCTWRLKPIIYKFIRLIQVHQTITVANDRFWL